MRIVYFYQYFTTPRGAWSTRAYEFARRWVEAGDHVTVVTSVYDKSDLQPSGLVSRIEVDGIDVVVLNIGLSNKHGTFRRLYSFAAYAVLASYFAIRLPSDVVVVSSGPMTAGIPGLMARFLKRSTMVFEVRDLWPEGAIQLGILKNQRLIRLARWFETACYRSASRIVALSDGMAAHIGNGAMARVRVVPNAADNVLFGRSNGVSLPDWAATRKLVVYAGTIGLMDDCHQIIAMAEYLQKLGRTDLMIIMLGDGRERVELEAMTLARGITNVRFVGLLPKHEVAEWLRRAVCALVVFRPLPVFDTNSPNKLFDSLAAGTPVIQTTQGWIKALLEKEHCGLTVQPRDPESMALAVVRLADDPLLRSQMSENARRVAREQFDRDHLAHEMRRVLLEAAGVTHG